MTLSIRHAEDVDSERKARRLQAAEPFRMSFHCLQDEHTHLVEALEGSVLQGAETFQCLATQSNLSAVILASFGRNRFSSYDDFPPACLAGTRIG